MKTLSPQTRPAHRNEAAVALLLAAAAVGGLVLTSSWVVLWDVAAFRAQVQRFFSVDFAPLPAEPPRTNLTESGAGPEDIAPADTARELFGETTAILGERPGGVPAPGHDWHPETARLPRAESRAAPDDSPLASTAPHTLSPALDPAVSVLAIRRRVAGPGEAFAPDLPRRYDPDTLGNLRLGSPGATLQRLDAPPMPTPPGHALPRRTPTLAPTLRVSDAGPLTRRLVRERPPRGYPELDGEIAATFELFAAPDEPRTYFRLTLRPRPEARLATLPKDVLFLIDISQSVPHKELRALKDAVIAYLRKLRPEDRWNVVLFAEEAAPYFADYRFRPADEVDPEALDRFVRRRLDQKQTDVFEATRLILARIPDSTRPCNVFLLSDGKATEGMADVRQIVRDFSRARRDNYAVFTFDAGKGGNRYLLSLLSYRSRGELRAERELVAAPEALARFLRTYDEPVLVNTVVSHTGEAVADVYPRVLSNLYRGAPMRLLGRVKPGGVVTVRVAGLVAGDEPREFFFRAPPTTPDPALGDIRTAWARDKAHALIADLGEAPQNERLRAQILELARRHDLPRIREMVERKWWEKP